MNMFSIVLLATVIVARPMHAQERVHTPGMVHTAAMAPAPPVVLPTQGGQGAFTAISEIIRLLEADSTTDWSRVNLERLRLHCRTPSATDAESVCMRWRASKWVPCLFIDGAGNRELRRATAPPALVATATHQL